MFVCNQNTQLRSENNGLQSRVCRNAICLHRPLNLWFNYWWWRNIKICLPCKHLVKFETWHRKITRQQW